MEIFHPSVFLAIFPYLFIGSFPVFGLILVTKWIVDDIKKRRTNWYSSNWIRFTYAEVIRLWKFISDIEYRHYMLNTTQKRCALCEIILPEESAISICENCLKNADCCVGLEKLRE